MNDECCEGDTVKTRKFCEANSTINPLSRMSAVMEQLRVADLNCCKEAYVTATQQEKCILPPTCP